MTTPSDHRDNPFRRAKFWMALLLSCVLAALDQVAAADFSTFAQRRAWVLEHSPTNADVKGFVLAEIRFARGENANRVAAALSASRSLVADHLAKPAEQVQLFNIWPAMDCYPRFGVYLDEETRSNVQYVVTHFLGYSGTSTANLKTLGHVVRYLGSEAFGEAAFATNAIWRADDPNAYNSLLALIANNATSGFGEHASPTPVNLWEAGSLKRDQGGIGRWAQEVSRITRVEFFDVNLLMSERYEQLGPTRVEQLLCSTSDPVHTSPAGAKEIATLVAFGLKRSESLGLAGTLRI